VWVGKNIRPTAFCKTREEVNAMLQTLTASQLDRVTVGTLAHIKPVITATF
jgi:hypothetical protein